MIYANRRHVGFTVAMVVGISLSVLASRHRTVPKLIYNPSASAPRGWYMVRSTADLHRGETVLVQLPAPIAKLADDRRYLPKTVPLLKSVVAVAPDLVCEQQGVVRINNTVVARSLQRDGAGRALVAWSDCRKLRAGELFLLGTTSAASFDSRYYGPISTSSVIAKAISVWTW